MRSPLASPFLGAQATRLFAAGLGHTYTRTPITPGARSGYSTRTKTPGTAVTGVRCRYVPRTNLDTVDGGQIIAQEPPSSGGTLAFTQTLTVLPDDLLKVGDQVSDIRDSRGVLLLAGPVEVQADMPHAGFGPTTLRMLVLKGAVVERNV